MISFDFEELNKLYPDMEIQFEKDYDGNALRIRIIDNTHTYVDNFQMPIDSS